MALSGVFLVVPQKMEFSFVLAHTQFFRKVPPEKPGYK